MQICGYPLSELSLGYHLFMLSPDMGSVIENLSIAEEVLAFQQRLAEVNICTNVWLNG